MMHAVIMAGGAGTRFWPASRSDRPKQLLKLVGDQTMVQATVARLGDMVPADRILVVTNARLAAAIKGQLPELPTGSVLGEPCKRDTAPCIGLAAIQIAQSDPDATMIVMPSDHVIHPPESFRSALRYAAELVDSQPDRLVTFGIKPTYAAETFGYIERGPLIDEGSAAAAFQVRQFREKPKADVARQYVDSGDFYWNSGIFVWRADTIMRELAQREPQMVQHLQAIAASIGKPDFPEVLEREFTAIRGKSIDYAVMEHASDVVVIEAPFEWDDVGSWQAIARLRGIDQDGNTVDGRHLAIDTRGSIVRTNGNHLVVTVGLEERIVAHTDDATLVASKDHEESIRDVVKQLEEKGWNEFL